MNRLNIRWRITLWITTAFAAVLIAFGIMVYFLLRETHYEQLDRRLQVQLEKVDSARRQGVEPQSIFMDQGHSGGEHQEVAGAIFDSSRNLVARQGEFPEANVLFHDNHPEGPHFDTTSIAGRGRYRRLVAPLATGETLVLLAELEHVDEEMNQVLNVLIVTIPITLIVAAMLAYFLAKTALAPVENLRLRTDEITAAKLDQRLPIQNPNDELGRLGKTINDMIGRLERSFHEIKRFTADASHELRTPLAVIRSEAELAMNSSQTLEDVRVKCASIVEECEHLTTLTDQLLLLSREDAGVNLHQTESIDLIRLVRDVVDDVQPWIESKGVRLTSELPEAVPVCGSTSSLRRVLLNLLDNAAKFTSAGGTIEIAVKPDRSDALIRVTDSGQGISEADLPHVFDRFYRGPQGRANQKPGSGLGLSIVHSIVLAHGGRIEIKSQLNQGTAVSISLPAERPGISKPESVIACPKSGV
jgi:heavy metal sensor kinase